MDVDDDRALHEFDTPTRLWSKRSPVVGYPFIPSVRT